VAEAPIVLVSYDPAWPALFEAEKAQLEPLLAPWRRGSIEHIGSTSVTGLVAKPVIDVMVGVTSLVESRPAIVALTDAGYQYSEYKTEVIHWFCKPSFAFRTHHLHLVPYGSPLWLDSLAFRDLLRHDATWRDAYLALKLELAAKFEHDRDAYTEGKSPFIQRALACVGR
jgi:GrpB-like predicted nucleotidyltransferase (UPF0157 family)